MVSRATIVLIVYFIQGTLGHAVPQTPIAGIAGGHIVNITDAPYMASVHFDGYYCGGSIIHEQFVLTAAHCVLQEHQSSDYVRVGSSKRIEGGKELSIEKYIRHEEYKIDGKDKHNYDVGLVKLSQLLNFDLAVAPINLTDSNFEIYSWMKANVSGWGRTVPRVYTNELHQVSVTITPLLICHHSYGNDEFYSNKTICGFDIGAGTCVGDSGGPLVVDGRQIGIVSSGGPRETCGYAPTSYVKVSGHLQWINHQLTHP